MDDAQKRAADFNTEQRIAELEDEIRRLRLALKAHKSWLMNALVESGSRRSKKKPMSEEDAIEQVRLHPLEKSELVAEVARLRLELKQRRAEDEVSALVRGLKALVAGRIIVTQLPKKKAPKKTPREERSRMIREAGKKDRKVLDRLRDHDKKP